MLSILFVVNCYAHVELVQLQLCSHHLACTQETQVIFHIILKKR